MSVGLVFNLLAFIVVLAILVLAGRWLIGLLGLGEPWPTILILVVVLLVLGAMAHLWVGGGFIRVGALMPLLATGVG